MRGVAGTIHRYMQRFRLFGYHIIHPEEEILLFSDTFKGWDAKEQEAPVPYFVNNLFIRSLKARMSQSGIFYVYL